jgi:Tfp pilus assembly protein PilZ
MGEWRKADTGIQRSRRVETAVPVRVSTVDPESDPNTGKPFFRSSEETTANISHGGAFVRSWEPLEAGRRVIVDIDLPGGERLQLFARVAWTQRQLRAEQATRPEAPGFGIEFTKASRSELARLDRFLEGLANVSSKSRSIHATMLVPPP